jgi:putative aldouronate transport system substrate-binding protein
MAISLKKLKLTKALMALSISSLLLSACSTGEKQAVADTKTKSNNEIRILAGVVGGKTDDEQKLFVQEIEKKTGLKVDMVSPPANYDQKLLTSMSSGDQYDLVYLNTPDMDVLVNQGALTKLNDDIKKSKVLSDPSIISKSDWKAITYKGGSIYGVYNKAQQGTLPVLRKDWLDKLGLKEPKTLDEFYTVLKAFKEKDPDGDGKNDTYGLSLAGLFDIQPFMSAVGVKAEYVINKNGKRTIPYATEAAVPVYEWLAKLYKEGILDPNFLTNDTSKMRNLFMSNRVGMVTDWDAWVGLYNNTLKQRDPNTTFHAEGIPGVKGPNGIMLTLGDPSLWAIPANAKNPEGAIKFLEFWHSQAGNLLSTLGVEGYDYTVKNGKYELTEAGKAAGMDHGVIFPNNSHFKNPIGFLPGVAEAHKVVTDNNATNQIATKDWPNAQKIVYNYAFKAIMGTMPATEAVKQMHDELKAANLIDQ